MTSSRCAGCRYLRRKCPSTCILSPYFPPNNPPRFLYVHKIYGASNVSKMLQIPVVFGPSRWCVQQVPVQQRAQAADSLYYEAQCRMNDPVYGCVGIITLLQQQVYNAQCELAKIEAEVAVINNNLQTYNFSSNNVNYDQLFRTDTISATVPAAAEDTGDEGGGINEAALTLYDPSFQPQFRWD